MANRYLLGFDVGSSSVKASLVNADSGKCEATAFYPEKEAPIMPGKTEGFITVLVSGRWAFLNVKTGPAYTRI